MSKNFSVEWLSQSFHDNNIHKPCDASSEIEEVENKASTSPLSKYDLLSLMSLLHTLCLSIRKHKFLCA